MYSCMCGRRRTLPGKALSLYYARVRNTGLRPLLWNEVPAEKFEISAA
jgi:hypothetical protein